MTMNSVTRLVYFRKVMTTNIFTKLAKIFSYLLGNFENVLFS